MAYWNLADGSGYEVPLPAPRQAGGHSKAKAGRLHAKGYTYQHASTWLGVDLWDVRDGEHTQLAANLCRRRALLDSPLQLLVTAPKGCAVSKTDYDLTLYNEETMPPGPHRVTSRDVLA